ncbi:MAG TPA: hypothetical protein VI336_00135 [Candidatus Saccharimonadales bacterium]|nr:hypothetical protein [Candidatus Saccharimonadales bacterium]
MNHTRRFKKKSSLLRKHKILIPTLAAVALLLFAGLELTNAVDFINTKQAGAPDVTSSGSSQATNDKSLNEEASKPSPSPASNQETPKSTNSSNQYLKSPDQSTYVNNHEPSSRNELLYSTCVTSPGATCVIQFTKSGVTKPLQPGVADSYGSVYWTWRPSDIGLTTGSWTITAKATLNGQTKTSQDVIKLQIP